MVGISKDTKYDGNSVKTQGLIQKLGEKYNYWLK